MILEGRDELSASFGHRVSHQFADPLNFVELRKVKQIWDKQMRTLQDCLLLVAGFNRVEFQDSALIGMGIHAEGVPAGKDIIHFFGIAEPM